MKVLLGLPKIVIEALRLDIEDMNYVFFNPNMLERITLTDYQNVLPKKGVLIRIAVFFYHLAANLKPFEWRRFRSIEANSIIFFASTKNQKDSLLPVSQILEGSYLIGSETRYPFSFVFFFAYLLSIPFFPIAFMKFLLSHGVTRKGFQYVFDLCWLTYGYYISTRIWLRHAAPSVLVVANDHNMDMRTIVKAAQAEGVPTVYLQHASINSDNAALSFDYALLEGYDALYQYNQCGSTRTKAFLIGMPKFDNYFQKINSHSSVSSMGICTNWLEPMQRAEELGEALRRGFPERQIILRPHPADSRISSWNEMAKKHNLSFSNPTTEDAFEFLCKVDMLFAGISSILLEATLLNVYPIFYDFSLDPRLILYSFLKTGLCERISNPEAACDKIRILSDNKPSIRERAQYYCATVSTEHDGRSSQLAGKMIREIESKRTVDLDNWKRIDQVALEAYKLHDRAEI